MKSHHYTGTAADLPVETFNGMISMYVCPMLKQKKCLSKGPLDVLFQQRYLRYGRNLDTSSGDKAIGRSRLWVRSGVDDAYFEDISISNRWKKHCDL